MPLPMKTAYGKQRINCQHKQKCILTKYEKMKNLHKTDSYFI